MPEPDYVYPVFSEGVCPIMTHMPRRPRARAIAIRAEEARQALIRRAILAVAGGMVAAAGLAAVLNGGGG